VRPWGQSPGNWIGIVWSLPVILALRIGRQEDQNFKFILSCIRSSRSAWATQETLLKKKKKDMTVKETKALKKKPRNFHQEKKKHLRDTHQSSNV
jgi:hypothetical protein